MSGSKLVENLAESLVNELSESKTLDLMNDTKFQEFTDLLWEILDRVDKAEDRAKEKEEEEPLNEVKELAGKINDYFGKGGDDKDALKDLSFNTSRILKIVQNLQAGGGTGEGGDKKKSSDKDDNKETNKKVAAEKKAQEKAEVDKQTTMMLRKLTKDFEESEKKRKKENSIVRKGLRRVEKKIGNLLTKALKKLKIPLLILAFVLFRKKIKNFFKNFWKDHLEPRVKPIIKWLGGVVGGLFENFKTWFKDTYPELYDWIKTEWPKLKDWVKENWDKVREFFSETLIDIYNAVNNWLDKSWLGKQVKKLISNVTTEGTIDEEKEKIAQYGFNSVEGLESRIRAAKALSEYREKTGEYDKRDGALVLTTGAGQMDVLSGTDAFDSKASWERISRDKDKEVIAELERKLEIAKRDRYMQGLLNESAQTEISPENQYATKSSFFSGTQPTLPEDDNPEGGGTGSGLGDVIPNSAGTVIDNSSRTHNETHNTTYIFKNVPPYESGIE